MAADFLTVNKGKQPGNQTVALAGNLLTIQETISVLYNAANHMVNGGDYTMLETNFGLEAGKGANFVTLLGYLNEIFNTNTDVTGANRAARIAEYTSRLFPQ